MSAKQFEVERIDCGLDFLESAEVVGQIDIEEVPAQVELKKVRPRLTLQDCDGAVAV